MAFLTTIFSLLTRSQRPRLEMLLESARDSAESRVEFYRSLLSSTLYVPGERRDDELFIRPYDIDGRKTLLAFTSPERLAEGLRVRSSFLSIEAATLFAALPAFDTLVLNYRTRTQKECTPSEIRALLDGTIFEREGERGEVLLGQPKVHPVMLMEALKEKLPARPDVQAAYLAQRFDPATMIAPQIVIAFDTTMSAADFETFRANAARLAVACGAGDVLFTRLGDDATGEYMRREAEAFYER